eukprot:COSAG06_NODE_5687_length_3319_cov_64.771796_2_plen_189_part_00
MVPRKVAYLGHAGVSRGDECRQGERAMGHHCGRGGDARPRGLGCADCMHHGHSNPKTLSDRKRVRPARSLHTRDGTHTPGAATAPPPDLELVGGLRRLVSLSYCMQLISADSPAGAILQGQYRRVASGCIWAIQTHSQIAPRFPVALPCSRLSSLGSHLSSLGASHAAMPAEGALDEAAPADPWAWRA